MHKVSWLRTSTLPTASKYLDTFSRLIYFVFNKLSTPFCFVHTGKGDEGEDAYQGGADRLMKKVLTKDV